MEADTTLKRSSWIHEFNQELRNSLLKVVPFTFFECYMYTPKCLDIWPIRIQSIYHFYAGFVLHWWHIECASLEPESQLKKEEGSDENKDPISTQIYVNKRIRFLAT